MSENNFTPYQPPKPESFGIYITGSAPCVERVANPRTIFNIKSLRCQNCSYEHLIDADLTEEDYKCRGCGKYIYF